MATPILVVDDDEVLGRILARVLEGDGYEVIRAATADQALHLAGQSQPQLALLDLCMPGTNGVELGRLLREQVPGVSLILMTAYPLRLRDYPALAGDFSRVLVKPLDLGALRQSIAAVLVRPGNGTGIINVG